MEPKIIDYSKAFLKLNISGKRYKILKSTAFTLHGSLFAELASLLNDDQPNSLTPKRSNLSPEATRSYYLIDSNEFFYERSSIVFDYVLNYAYTGRLHCPEHALCKEMLLDELEFWRLIKKENREETKFQPCCHQEEEKEEEEKDSDEVEEDAEEKIRKPKSLLGKVWTFCEDPGSSVGASILNIISIFFIVLSIVNLILSTVRSLHHCPEEAHPENATLLSTNGTGLTGDGLVFTNVTTGLNDDDIDGEHPCEGGPIFDLIETICIGWFTLELVVRFISCPNKLKFFKSPMNIIDILATAPFYIELILRAANVSTKKLLVVYAFRLIRILRIMRALRLARYFDSVRMMGRTFKRCRKDLSVLLVFVGISVIIASSVVYYFERDHEGTPFTSIPMSMWWAIVTLTTVGYGDFAPSTSGGRVSAGIICVMGIIVMAMPISILVERFSQSYKRERKIKRKHHHAHVGDLLKKVSTTGSKRSMSVVDEANKSMKEDSTRYTEGDALVFMPKRRQI